MEYRYLFGPVPSRRFGRSLGIDLVPYKTCSFNCPFCEVGRTTATTCERREYVPTNALIAEFRQWLHEDGHADVVTLAGSGEPTLHARFGEVIDAIKASCRIPIVLLTNSSLLHLAAVRNAAARADIVKGSLSAWDEASFERVNHPAAGLTLDQVVRGLRAFRDVFPGQLQLEVFLMRGVNDDPADVARIAALAEPVRPEVIQLNTVVRPPAEATATALSRRDLEALAPLFSPRAEIIARFRGAAVADTRMPVTGRHVLAMVMRRPCTRDDIAGAFEITPGQVDQLVEALLLKGEIRAIKRPDGVYYAA